MDQDLSAEEANKQVIALFGNGSLVEAREGGFLVWRPPQPGSSGAAEGMSLPPRELIGRGTTRREALDSARRALRR